MHNCSDYPSIKEKIVGILDLVTIALKKFYRKKAIEIL